MDFSNIDLVVAVDPGKGGAISVYRNKIITTVYMPKTEKDLNDYFKYLREISENPILFCEHVQARPSDMIGGKAFAIIKMLKQYNELSFCIKSHHIPLIPVYPITWQTRLKIHIKGEDYGERKKRLKLVAQEFHPELKVTLKNCDSILILRFARYMLQNDPDWVSDRFPQDYKLF
jgi:hypothetical protein